MKQLITAMAAVILILALIIEIVSTQMFFINIIRADYTMSSHNDVIRQLGLVTEECERDIKNDLAEIFGCTAEDVSVTSDYIQVPFNGYIKYEIKSKAGSLFNSKFWGIANSDMGFCREYVLVSQCEKNHDKSDKEEKAEGIDKPEKKDKQ